MYIHFSFYYKMRSCVLNFLIENERCLEKWIIITPLSFILVIFSHHLDFFGPQHWRTVPSEGALFMKINAFLMKNEEGEKHNVSRGGKKSE